MPVVEVRQLTKSFNHQPVVRPLSFQVAKGEILGFLGPNGAGKSTTMKMLAGCLRPSQGQVRICGHDLSTHPHEAKSCLGYLPEHNPLYLDMYVHEYLQFMGSVRGLSQKKTLARAEELVARCGITEMQHKKLRILSKGYRQRVGLAQALMHDPEVLILDEPTTGLDPNQLREIRALIQEVSKEKAVILSTHIMQEVAALCSHVLIMRRGSMMAHNTLAELTAAGPTQVVVEFKEPIASHLLEELPGIQQIHALSPKRFRLTSSHTQDLRASLFYWAQAHGCTLLALEQQQQSLEDLFQKLTSADSVSSQQIHT